MEPPGESSIFNALPFETIDASLWPGEDDGHHSGSSPVFDWLPNELMIKILNSAVFSPGETDDDWELQFLHPTNGIASTFGAKRGRGVQITDELRRLSRRTLPVLRSLLRVCKRWRTMMRPYCFQTLILDGMKSVDRCAERFSQCLQTRGDTPGRWTVRLIIAVHGFREWEMGFEQGWNSFQTVIRCIPDLKFISLCAKSGRYSRESTIIPTQGIPEPVMAALCLSSTISKTLRMIELPPSVSSCPLYPFTPSVDNARDFISAFPHLVAFHSTHFSGPQPSIFARVTKDPPAEPEGAGSSLASVADFLALAPMFRNNDGVLPRFKPLPSLREVGFPDRSYDGATTRKLRDVLLQTYGSTIRTMRFHVGFLSPMVDELPNLGTSCPNLEWLSIDITRSRSWRNQVQQRVEPFLSRMSLSSLKGFELILPMGLKTPRFPLDSREFALLIHCVLCMDAPALQTVRLGPRQATHWMRDHLVIEKLPDQFQLIIEKCDPHHRGVRFEDQDGELLPFTF